jgi:hypothetical protein
MSGFVPGFENDLFISYAHADDPVWMQAFEKSLGEEVSRRLGLKVSVWQDAKRLRVGQNWKAEIEAGVARSAVFIAVLSPSYANSEWCARERRVFIQCFASQEVFENSNRFFKVLKTPWEDDEHRYFLATIQAVELFRREEGPAGDAEFLPGSIEFRHAIGCLSNSVAQTLRRLRRERERVFVASPADDCLDVWRQLRDELRDQGYDVQPEGRRDAASFADEFLRDEMEHALLSVHLLGAAHDPFVERQIRLAADLERKLMFWIAPGADATADANQARLIQILGDGKRPDRPSAELPPGWMLLRDRTPRSLIDEVLASLRPKQAVAAQRPANGGVPRVYIVHDATTEEDSRIASTLKEEIRQRERMEVFLSRSDLPSATDLRLRHQMLLQTCEGVLLCHKAAPKEWLMQVAPEVIFAERFLQRAPLKSKAFLVPDPATWNEWPNLKVIPYNPQFRLCDLEPFLAPLRQGGNVPHAG